MIYSLSGLGNRVQREFTLYGDHLKNSAKYEPSWPVMPVMRAIFGVLPLVIQPG
jgi:hypothetical protein